MKAKFIAITVLAVAIAGISCTKHDPSYDEVVAPTVDFEPAGEAVINLIGKVTDKQGKPIAGASINIAGKIVTTDANGTYSATVSAGTLNVTATATGKIARSAEVVIADTGKSQTVTQNFILSDAVNVTFSASNNAKEETEYIVLNNRAEVSIKGSVVSDTEGATFGLTIFYDESEIGGQKAASTKASETEEVVLFGFEFYQITGTPGAKATFSVTINKEVQDNVKVKYRTADGTWQQQFYTAAPGEITIKNAPTGFYAVFCDVTMAVNEASKISLEVDPSEVDNLYGDAPVSVDKINYTYYSGLLIDTAQAPDQMTALLLEKLAYYYGITRESINEDKAISVTIPVGIAMNFAATQKTYNIVFSKGNKKAVGLLYGEVEFGSSSRNRKHTGGGN